MNTAKTIDAQILAQIEGTQTLDVQYTNIWPEHAELIVQGNRAWLRPLFRKPHKITPEELKEIHAMIHDEREFNTDPLMLYTNMEYNQFWDRYYNGRKG